MCVYTEGEGEETIVFLSGSGTPSPILDFKSLYTQLAGEYKIVVVEKFGYGFSDDSDRSRDIDSILEDTREALTKAGVQAPYVLCPHSLSGLEAIYWSQKYPDEVSAIVGLDMDIPECYMDMKINTASMKFYQVLRKMGVLRLVSGSVNILYNDSMLTESEKSVIKALYSQRGISDGVINEAEMCNENAKIINEGGASQVPVLMFLSNAEGIDFDKEEWICISKKFVSQIENGEYIQLDCPHYVHNYEYKKIAEEIKRFLGEDDE